MTRDEAMTAVMDAWQQRATARIAVGETVARQAEQWNRDYIRRHGAPPVYDDYRLFRRREYKLRNHLLAECDDVFKARMVGLLIDQDS